MIEGFFCPEEALRDILEGRVKTVMVLGASDSGKTTMVKVLAKYCAKSRKTAVMDIDPGQSHIGPPTTVAWAVVDEKFEDWDKLEMAGFYFIGDISPTSSLLSTVTGAKIVWEKASQAAEIVIVDTSGLIRGSLGRNLKLHLIDLLNPELILALHRKDELDHILSFYQGIKVPRIYKIPVPGEVERKDFSQRRLYREGKFRNYFQRAKDIEFVLREIGLDEKMPSEYLSFRLVSLRDKFNRDIALGIVKQVDKIGGTVTIYSPVSLPEKVGAVVLGKIRLSPEGKQLTDF